MATFSSDSRADPGDPRQSNRSSTAPSAWTQPCYGPIVHELMQARALADSDLLLLHIDTALMLLRQAHHNRILNIYSGDGTNYTAGAPG